MPYKDPDVARVYSRDHKRRTNVARARAHLVSGLCRYCHRASPRFTRCLRHRLEAAAYKARRNGIVMNEKHLSGVDPYPDEIREQESTEPTHDR